MANCKNPKCKKDEPIGYLGWHDWAKKKSKTHKQKKCPMSGVWFMDYLDKTLIKK